MLCNHLGDTYVRAVCARWCTYERYMCEWSMCERSMYNGLSPLVSVSTVLVCIAPILVLHTQCQGCDRPPDPDFCTINS